MEPTKQPPRWLLPGGAAFGLLLLYLLFWPVPVDPVAWQAPADLGYRDPYAPNRLLEPATDIDLGDYFGPEDATADASGIYVSTKSGAILRLRNGEIRELARVDGRPLGLEVAADGSLVVANAALGLQRITRDGMVSNLLSTIEGRPVYPNNLDIRADGTIFFSEASAKFAASRFGGTYEASLLDILEHGGHGSVYSFDPASGAVRQLLTGLNYANGVAVSDSGDYVVVAETGAYRIHKIWLSGERAGSSEVLLDNLPGFPDNVRRGQQGRFWIGLIAPRNAILDRLSDKPWLRKVVQRLPAFVRPKAQPVSHVLAIDGDGNVLMNLHGPSNRYPSLTGVLETRDALFLTTLFGNRLPLIAKRDLAN